MKQLAGYFLILCICTGCSSGPSRPVCYPISGKVLFNNQPIAEAQITFHPKSGEMTPLPSGFTDETGQFTITTWTTNDGAPVGDYAVTISWKAQVVKGEEKVRSGRQLLAVENTDPKRSPWKCTVKEGANPPLLFDVKR